jgi:pilus assembly protein CpaC
MTKKCLPPLILSAFFLLGWFLLTDSVTAQSHIFHLAVGEAQVLTLKGITRIAISNPDVLELVVTGKHEFLLNAKKAGTSSVNVWSGEGRFEFRFAVQEDYSVVEMELAKLIDNPDVTVEVNEKYVVLSGAIANSLEEEEAVRYGKMYRDHVINNLKVKTAYQILLSVLVTEIKKDAEKKYGFNSGTWWPTPDGLIFHEWEYGFLKDRQGEVDLAPGVSLGSLLNLMQRNGDAKILAAPSILTVSGKEAFFLAGGEIPIPMSDGKGGVTVNWKEYGIRLKVTANYERDNIISMAVTPEVSSIDWSNAIIVNGFKLPALATRKANTNVRFKDGSTLVIGGLLRREEAVNIYKVPILGDIPIIGSLFRSKNFQNGDTELLLFVTPKLIKDETNLSSKEITGPAFQGPFFETPKK